MTTRNIQVIDGAVNCTYEIFAISEHHFTLLFPEDGQDIEFSEDFFARQSDASHVFAKLWSNPVDKKTVVGIHGTLFCGMEHKRRFYPTKRSSEMSNP